MIVAVILVGPIAPVILTAVPEVMKKQEQIAFGMGVASFCQNLGLFISTSLFVNLLEVTTWSFANHLMITICAFAIIITLTAIIR